LAIADARSIGGNLQDVTHPLPSASWHAPIELVRAQGESDQVVVGPFWQDRLAVVKSA
jgi:hypothetical protein